ncbi:MAG: CPBP family intramembrane glutamic endopeptidase [Methyloligellaceae bacterium]
MLQKSFELTLLYIIAPIIAFILVHSYQIPLVMILLPMFFVFALLLFMDREFYWKTLFTQGFGWADSVRIFLLFVVSGFALTALAWYTEGHHFLAFARDRTNIWLLVMFLYPLISVTTQELMYRVLFFHRYAGLFGDRAWLAILMNAVFFSYCHILFLNWHAIIITFIGGLIFAYTYQRTRSFWAVCLEHSLYGCLMFTVGFGRYFFTGVSNFNF